jgi:hypothetical protein
MDGIKLDLIETKAEGPVADVREDAYHKLNRTQRDDKRGRMRIKYMCIDLGKYKDPKGRRGELLDPAVELVYWRFSTAMLTLALSAFSPTQLCPMRRRHQQVSAKDLRKTKMKIARQRRMIRSWMGLLWSTTMIREKILKKSKIYQREGVFPVTMNKQFHQKNNILQKQ